MGNLSALSGAPTLALIYISNLFLTNFGFNLYPAFAFFLTYGSFYIISTLNSGHGLNSRNKNLFLLHLVLLFYGFLMFYLFEVGLLDRDSSSWWSINSLTKFLSIIIASLAVIVTPINKIIKSISIIKNISYFMVFGSILYYLLPLLGLNFLSSDFLAGYRYNGGINSYIIAGQFLLAGFIAHILFNQKAKSIKLLMAVAFFGFAIIATKDRTTLGAFFIIVGILFYKSGFGLSPFNFRIRKPVVLMFLLPITLVFTGLQYQSITSGNLDSYKSTIHRVTISIRSYEMFQEVFPTGAGPGSQTFLMNEQRINADFLEDAGEDALLTGALVKEVEGFQSKVQSGQTTSPHNTYVDFLVPFGAMGLFFVLCVLIVQLGSAKRILFDKRNKTTILDSFAVSTMFFFMFSSLFNLWWLYLIYYRMLISRKIN